MPHISCVEVQIGHILAFTQNTLNVECFRIYKENHVPHHCMAKVYDVPPNALIERMAVYLKENDIPCPSWTSFVKTGAHAERPPQQRDWWYVRCASILRKIYLNGPVGVNQLRMEYGGGKPSGYGAAHHRPAGGAIIRNAIHGLEKLGLVGQMERRGRIITKEGMKRLDNMSTQILNEMIAANPSLKVYK